MKTVSKKRLVLECETVAQLTNNSLADVKGGATPSLVISFIVTMLSCGFFCNPQKAR
jgi:hypothetical protein